jgi:hypothetical protein
LRYAEDMAVADIAPVVGKTRVHVKVLLFRARQALARELRSRRAPGPGVLKVERDSDAQFPRRTLSETRAVAGTPPGLIVTSGKGSL